VFRRAVREIRVIAGLILIAAAIAVGVFELSRVTGQADRDFATCGLAITPAADCESKHRPVSVGWVSSSSNGFRREYEVSVETRPSFTFSLGGLSKSDIAPFEGLESAEVRYHEGRLTAIVAPDGTALKVPFAFSKELLFAVGFAFAGGLLGMGSIAWGFTRINRTPKA
jgi:hypothetical protein